MTEGKTYTREVGDAPDLAESVRAALDAHWSKLIVFRDAAGLDRELVEYIQSAIDGNCDSLSEIGGLIKRREAEDREKAEAEESRIEQERNHGRRWQVPGEAA